jgi:hypothetical protein
LGAEDGPLFEFRLFMHLHLDFSIEVWGFLEVEFLVSAEDNISGV